MMALLPEVIRLGPVLLSTSSVVLLLSFFLGAFLLKKSMNRHAFNGESLGNDLIQAVFIGFLAERVITLSGEGSLAWNQIRILLFSKGPSYATWAAGVLAMLYLLWRASKAGDLSWKWLSAWVVPIGITVTFYSLCLSEYGRITTMPWGVWGGSADHHPVSSYRVLLWGIATWYLHKVKSSAPRSILLAVVSFSAVEVVISWFSYHDELWHGLAPIQWGALLLFIAGFIGLTFRKSRV